MKILKKWMWIIGGATLIAFSTIVILFPDNAISSSTQSAAVSQQAVVALPVRLKIPAIKVDAAVIEVGLDADGAMDAPEGPGDVAWYKLGPRPGEKGSAVLAGHFGWKNNIPAVFDELSKLKNGDKIYVENDDGTVATFSVRESRLFGEKGNAAEVFTSNDGTAHLNLITCEGVWNKETKSYSQRLVVFADKV